MTVAGFAAFAFFARRSAPQARVTKIHARASRADLVLVMACWMFIAPQVRFLP